MSESESKSVEFEFSRSFDGPTGESTYYIITPTAKDIRGADWEYSKTYTKSLVEGITTTAEMTDILMVRGIIGPDFDQRSHELTKILAEKVETLDSVDDIDKKADAAIAVAIAREELFQWNQRLNAPLANTCEQISDDMRLEYLTSSIILNENGNRVWPDFDAYLVGKDQGLAQKARFEVMLFLQGLDSDFLERTPEAVAMKEVERDNLAAIVAKAAKEADAEAGEAESKKSPTKSKKGSSKKTKASKS